MTTITLAVCLLVGANAFHMKRPTLTIRLGALLFARQKLIPPVEDFPPGYDTLKREYQSYVWDEWDEYGVFRWDEMARQRPGYIKLMADIQRRQSRVEAASRAGINVRKEMNDELKHIMECEEEYENYEEWLEDMAHFENLPDFVQSLRVVLEESGAGSSPVSDMHNESASTSPIPACLTQYSDCYRKSQARQNEMLWDNDKQLALPTNHNVAGLRILVNIIDEAIVGTYNRDGNPEFYHVAKLRSLVEFLFPLLEDYLPSSPTVVDWSDPTSKESM